MKLQTKISLEPQKHNQIDYDSKIVLLGSCFSDNIGGKFDYFKFQSVVNPFGILFHPIAIENLIARSINKEYYTEDELIYNNEVYSSFDAHSKLNNVSKEVLLANLNSTLDKTNDQIIEATHVVITLGTSWVYRHIALDQVVANCQKVPQRQFLKEILSIDDIAQSLDAIISLVRSVNPKATFIFTVSPVRHLKDGFVENTRSKSHLIAAVHQIVDVRYQQYYFPSYEIVMDELRDYRFYSADMIHPNDLAIDYIWQKFQSVWLTEAAIQTSQNVANIQAKKAHRPFNPDSEAHREFLAKLQSEIEEIQRLYPKISF